MFWAGIGALLLGLAVMLGAFGAHALRDRLDTYAMGVYEKAVFYHFIHALGMLLVAALSASGWLAPPRAGRISLLLLLGVLFFSGSLYVLAGSGIRILGAVTPIGGVCFIAAWLLLAYELFQKS